MLLRHVLPAIFALFIWWASTVAIMFLYRRPRLFRWSFALATVALVVAFYGLWITRNDSSVLGAYIAFVCGVTISGWHLLSFYTGVATGPRLLPQHERWPRLAQAIYAGLYHELIGVGFAVFGLWLTWGSSNPAGIGTLLLLWVMHQSARLNVLLGVRNFDVRALPAHLEWVGRVVSRRSSNSYFPISIIVTVVLTGVFMLQALSPFASQSDAVGRTFLCLLMALALFEHALLMLPEPAFARQQRQPPPAMLPEE